MVNRVILVGNLVRDAELRNTDRTTVARLRLATNNTWTDKDGNRQESSEFHDLVVFGRFADSIAPHCTKGKRVYVEGQLRTRDYEGSDGVRRSKTEIAVDTLKLLNQRVETDVVEEGDA